MQVLQHVAQDSTSVLLLCIVLTAVVCVKATAMPARASPLKPVCLAKLNCSSAAATAAGGSS
jgi:hypothetical protein